MNKPVQVTLGEPFGSFVDSEVESGRFGSAQEVVEAGLRLLEEEQAKYAGLRQALVEGEQSGEPFPFDPEALMACVRDGWNRQAQAKLIKLRGFLIEGELSGEPRHVDRNEFVARMQTNTSDDT